MPQPSPDAYGLRLIARAPANACATDRSPARARLSLIWATARCIIGCNATAFLVRAILPLFADGGTWPPTTEGGTPAFLLDVIEVLFLWLVVGVVRTPANRQRAQRVLRRLTELGEGSSAVVSYQWSSVVQ